MLYIMHHRYVLDVQQAIIWLVFSAKLLNFFHISNLFDLNFKKSKKFGCLAKKTIFAKETNKFYDINNITLWLSIILPQRKKRMRATKRF